ncbi:MAG: O-antigen ligase family protein [Flavobacteriaceae bacterium]|nr:O-antigen ligase family protein [Flavobacteriaceae bacterium]
MMLFYIGIIVFILFFCFKKPIFGLALLIQINLIRAIGQINYSNPCYCINEPDIVLGAILPILGFIIIIFRLDFTKRIKYVFDEFDGFFLFATVLLFITSLYSPNLKDSLIYSFKFLFLGSSYYFIFKIIILNTTNYKKTIYSFLKFTLLLAVTLGTFAVLLLLLKTNSIIRLTIPGVHPIPFSQLIGFGVLISFVIFITNGSLINLQSKNKLTTNKIIFLYLTLILFATNTRGVLLSVIVAILFYFIITKVKIKKRTLYYSGAAMLLVTIIIINKVDVEVLFQRLLNSGNDKSITNRFIVYKQSFSIFFEHPFGVGPDGFKHFSFLDYPHNFFLENMVQYGIFGILLNIYFLLMGLLMFMITLKNRTKDGMFVFLYALFLFFFVETMFSFTFWMHKGLYLTIGIFAAYYYHFKKEQKVLKT